MADARPCWKTRSSSSSPVGKEAARPSVAAENARIASSSARAHSCSDTCCHAEPSLGTPPAFMASTWDWSSAIHAPPVAISPPGARSTGQPCNTLERSSPTCLANFGLISSSFICPSTCSCSSSSTGKHSVAQSLSGKSSLIVALASRWPCHDAPSTPGGAAASTAAPPGVRMPSIYCCAVILLPARSSSASAKSRRTHRKAGARR
mmetsp:Transcript_50953/g.137111  ORF Transcript_50953/g.137111 Transcript_50953/m.137111 type:complete len:206 (+) Transcript_50953:781-1398(+)